MISLSLTIKLQNGYFLKMGFLEADFKWIFVCRKFIGNDPRHNMHKEKGKRELVKEKDWTMRQLQQQP